MTDSAELGEDAAAVLAAIYRDAELRILERIAAALAAGIDTPEWEVAALSRAQSLRDYALAILRDVDAQAAGYILAALEAAYEAGNLEMLADIGGVVTAAEVSADARALATVALATEIAGAATSAIPSVLRGVDDVFRQVVADVVAQRTVGAMGRREAAQSALNTLVRAGLTSVPTRRGSMDLATYVEMAVRTGSGNAALAGQTDQALAMGFDIVAVQPGPRACDICDRWARVLLSSTGETGTLRKRSVTTGRDVVVRVDHTLAEARAAGWKHPNCRCTVRVYLPGVSRADELQRPPWDEAAYDAQQRQRAIERQIRAWKRREAAALDPATRADATTRVRSWQGAMRDLIRQYPFLKRQSSREQV